MVTYGNCASTDKIKSLKSWRNYFIIGANAPDVYAARWFSERLFTGSNGAASSRDSSQQISSHWFAEKLKDCCSKNSERLLWMPADEKDGSRRSVST